VFLVSSQTELFPIASVILFLVFASVAENMFSRALVCRLDVCFFSPALRVRTSNSLAVTNTSQKLHSYGHRRLLLRLFLGGVRRKGWDNLKFCMRNGSLSVE
jgi:hypothetical protein